MDISWFMRCLNEPIARFANKEEGKKGRFWEGRFKSQALLDEGAILSAMVYVDLNPIRAGVAISPETSEFTSIQERIQKVAKHLKMSTKQKVEHACDNAKQPKSLMAFANGKNQRQENKPTIDFRLSEYLALVDSTGRNIREDKRGAIPEDLAPILSRIYLNPRTWLNMVKDLQNSFSYAVGSETALMQFSKGYCSFSPKGISRAKRCYSKAA